MEAASLVTQEMWRGPKLSKSFHLIFFFSFGHYQSVLHGLHSDD